MSKLFILCHPKNRLRNDFFPCGTHIVRPPCSTCEGNCNGWEPPLLYFWEFDFGDPQDSFDAGHQCYWGEFRFMVTDEGRSILESLDNSFGFHETRRNEGKTLKGLPPGSNPFHYVTTGTTAAADVAASDNEVCPECGEFTKRRRPLTRLHIPKQNIPATGIFRVEQSGPHGPTFVTEDARETIVNSGLKGIGFSPAGRVV